MEKLEDFINRIRTDVDGRNIVIKSLSTLDDALEYDRHASDLENSQEYESRSKPIVERAISYQLSAAYHFERKKDKLRAAHLFQRAYLSANKLELFETDTDLLSRAAHLYKSVLDHNARMFAIYAWTRLAGHFAANEEWEKADEQILNASRIITGFNISILGDIQHSKIMDYFRIVRYLEKNLE